MSKVFTPRPSQAQMIQFLCDSHGFDGGPRVNLWARMGTGKTVAVLTYLDYLHRFAGVSRPTLVLAPKRVANSVWPVEAKKWAHLSGLPVVAFTGTEAERIAALKRDAAVYVTNYDNLLWLRQHFDGKPWPFGRCIPDESTRLKKFRVTQGGVRAQAIGQVAHKQMDGWVNMTGTPAPNGLADLWGQQWFIDKGRRLGTSYTAFEQRWFAWKRKVAPDGSVDRYASNMITLPHTQDEITDLLADCSLSVELPNLPEPVYTRLEVELPASARRHYKELQKEMFTELRDKVRGDVDVEVFNAAALTMKCLQLANGSMYLDADRYGKGAYIECHDAKLDALESVVEEAAGAPVLVAYQWKSDLDRLTKRFPKGRVLDDNPETIEQWNAGEIGVLFAHPQSAGHGLNLQDGGNILAFFGHWWDLELRQQIIERIGPARQLASGYDRPTFVIDIVAKDTVDGLVMARHATKANVQELLFSAMLASS